MTPRIGLFVLVGLAAGCKVGRPIVDRLEGRPLIERICAQVPACEENPYASDGIGPPPLTFCESPTCEERAWDDLPAQGADLRDVRVRIGAEQIRELTLSGARLRNVRIELEGPVTLHFVGHSSLTQVSVAFTDLQGAPSLMLDDAMVDGLEIVSQGDTRVGELTVRRSQLSEVNCRVARVDVSSGTLASSRLSADDLTLADMEVKYTDLDFGTALASATDLFDTRTTGCDQMTYAQGAVTGPQSVLGPCTRVLRVYGADVMKGAVEGPVDAVDSAFVNVVFGLQAATHVDGFSTEFKYVNFCAHAQRLRLGKDSSVHCALCDDDPALHACSATTGHIKLENNSCARVIDPPPACPHPWPVPDRPH